MLKICQDTLPDSDTTYAAFRLAACDTLERMTLAEQLGARSERPIGFLTEVPFLKHVPPQVQVELLAETWSKHRSRTPCAATLVDESVIYALCETSARLVSNDPDAARRFLSSGPCSSAPTVHQGLVGRIQALHLDLANEGDFLLISQFQDIPPDDARLLKLRFGLVEAECDAMFEALGRWHVRPEIWRQAAGLLTSAEIARVVESVRLRRSSELRPSCWPDGL
jgi:hypothetical protein